MQSSDTTQEPAGAEEPGWEWAVVEIFGHRRHAGRVREEERFGTKMLRVDVPIGGDPAQGWRTHYYGGSAIFSFSLTDETTVMQANAPYSPPHRLLPRPEIDDDNDDDDDDGLPF